MIENPVEHNPNPPAFCFPQQKIKGLFAAQKSVDLFVVRRIVPVIAFRLENRIQINRRAAKRFDIRKLLRDSL